MTALALQKSIDSAHPPKLRLWALPLITAILILIDQFGFGFNENQLTVAAALFIVIAGIPHGTLDVEIASKHFGHSTLSGKTAIIAAYLGVSVLMLLLWILLPEAAWVSFLVISIIHFGKDWRDGVDPFLAMMVGWALVSLPALSHPSGVGAIFEMLTGNSNGMIIAQLLACASVPAVLGSLVFAYWAYTQKDFKSAIEVVSCMIASIFLMPLVAFAIFFCGLHSPRHMAEAMRDTSSISPIKRAVVIAAVFALSIGMGVLFFLGQGNVAVDTGLIRTAFVLISTLTVPHFLLEHIMATRSSLQK
jgi:beta-carotene 15,15'-dioxygenase